MDALKLLIAIPALNEADAIDAIITRTLAARETIIAQSPIDEIEVTVVSDGSTDETVERASRYVPQVNLIVFPENKGYGAAIKEAWARSDADLLGFLDADGTCDPEFFTVLCSRLVGDAADIALGCRMNERSEMPRTRKLGNTIFATMLTYMSATGVRDVASGMRVVRRSSLPRMLPLPDGLHFTPAMSARAILAGDLRLVEIDMPYKERTGRSKLSIFKDGVRFFRIIAETAFLFRPGRLMWTAASIAALGSLIFVSGPLIYFIRHSVLQDWMIYRCAVAALLGIASVLLVSGGYLATRITDVSIFHRESAGLQGRARRLIRRRSFLFVPVLLVLVSVALGWTGLTEYISSGKVDTHWSRVLAMFTLVTMALILVVLKVLDAGISLVRARMGYLESDAASAVPEVAHAVETADVR